MDLANSSLVQLCHVTKLNELLAWLLLLVQQMIATPVFVKLLNGLVDVMFVKNNEFEIKTSKMSCFVYTCSSISKLLHNSVSEVYYF